MPDERRTPDGFCSNSDLTAETMPAPRSRRPANGFGIGDCQRWRSGPWCLKTWWLWSHFGCNCV